MSAPHSACSPCPCRSGRKNRVYRRASKEPVSSDRGRAPYADSPFSRASGPRRDPARGHVTFDALSLRLPEADRDLLRNVLTGLDDAQIARLLLAGELRDIARGTTLAEENEALERLYFICDGRVRVTIAGREVSHLERGNFVGEVAFLTEKPATATVIAEDDSRALVFETGSLSRFFRNETAVAGLIYQLLGRELAYKIRVSNSLIPTAGSLV